MIRSVRLFTRLLLFVTAAVLVLAPVKAGSLTVPYLVPVAANQWTTITNTTNGQPLPNFALTNLGDGSLSFDFPTGPDFATAGSINYLYTAKALNLDISHASEITALVRVALPAGVMLNHDTSPDNTCPPWPQPSTVRLMLWANKTGFGEFDRWWQNPSVLTMVDGSYQFVAPLVVDGSWSSVYGKANNYDAASRAGWAKALKHVSNFALTFGGGCFFGHGVYVTGSGASFNLQEYRVQ